MNYNAFRKYLKENRWVAKSSDRALNGMPLMGATIIYKKGDIRFSVSRTKFIFNGEILIIKDNYELPMEMLEEYSKAKADESRRI